LLEPWVPMWWNRCSRRRGPSFDGGAGREIFRNRPAEGDVMMVRVRQIRGTQRAASLSAGFEVAGEARERIAAPRPNDADFAGEGRRVKRSGEGNMEFEFQVLR